MASAGNYRSRNTLRVQTVEAPLTIASDQTGPGARGLADRLRDLREREFARLTQADLGQAIGDPGQPVSPATVSAWENPGSGRTAPLPRLVSYARLFCTPRSFEGGAPHLIEDGDLTPAERERMAELKEELIGLREVATGHQGADTAPSAASMWHFPDHSRITLVCSRLNPDRRPPMADPDALDYVRFSELADLDALVDIYGAIRAYNHPSTRVVITAAQDLTQRDVANHLVLIGGLAWETVNPFLGPIFPIPIKAGDPGEAGTVVIDDPDNPDGEKQEFGYRLVDGKLVEDVGFFARGENPAAPRRTLTIIGGITTRGVHGAARCFIDHEMRERNEQYLIPRFPPGRTYCLVMRVHVINGYPTTPDLSKAENRLYEWYERGAQAE
jgi:Helix-turn-helix domain